MPSQKKDEKSIRTSHSAFFVPSQTDAELAQKWHHSSERRSHKWRRDVWVGSELTRLEKNSSELAVYWPTGINERGHTCLSQYDEAFLSHMKNDPLIETILIPQDLNGHWVLDVIDCSPGNTSMETHRVYTRADGTCGDSLVDEAKNITKQGWASYHASSTPEANHVASRTPTTKIMSKKSEDDTAIKEAIDANQATLSPLDYTLARLADAEYANHTQHIEHYKTKAHKILSSMEPDVKEDAIQRLIDSDLDGKSSIADLIDRVAPTSASPTI